MDAMLLWTNSLSFIHIGIDGVRINSFIKCASDFDITPTFCSKKELRDCFEASLNNGNAMVRFLFFFCFFSFNFSTDYHKERRRSS